MDNQTQPAVAAPAEYVSAQGVSFGALGERATFVDESNPLPVAAHLGAARSVPLTGTAVATGMAGPFMPQLARAIMVTLSGVWSGSVQVLRSTDGGATRLPLTFIDGSVKALWTGNVNAVVGDESEAGASWYLAITLASGTLTYRVAQ